MCFDVSILIPGSFASAPTLGPIYSGGHPSFGIGSLSAFLSLLAAQQCQTYGFLTTLPERPPLVPISMGFLVHRPLASQETVLRVLPLLVLAHTFGAINGISTEYSSSAATLVYPSLSSAFLTPTERSGSPVQLVSTTHVTGCPKSKTDFLSRSLVGTWPYAAPSPLTSPVITHLPGPLLEVNCFLTASLALLRLPSPTLIYQVLCHTRFSPHLCGLPLSRLWFKNNVCGTSGLFSIPSHREELLVCCSLTAY